MINAVTWVKLRDIMLSSRTRTQQRTCYLNSITRIQEETNEYVVLKVRLTAAAGGGRCCMGRGTRQPAELPNMLWVLIWAMVTHMCACVHQAESFRFVHSVVWKLYIVGGGFCLFLFFNDYV